MITSSFLDDVNSSERSISDELTSSEDDQSFEILKNLILRVNEHADRQEYAVILDRIKKSKLKMTRKTWLVCDRERKFDSLNQKRRHTDSKRIECSFSCVTKRENDNDIWFLKMITSTHNHAVTLADAHSALRKLTMTTKIKSEISRVLTVQTASSKILFSLRVADLMTSVNFDDSENLYIVNFLFKSRDIYNLKTQLRREALESLTSMQALIRELNQEEENWT
jgi:hypothetical protein